MAKEDKVAVDLQKMITDGKSSLLANLGFLVANALQVGNARGLKTLPTKFSVETEYHRRPQNQATWAELWQPARA